MVTLPVAVPVRSADPPWEPVALEQARRHVGLPDEFTYHDDKLVEWIKESREQVEHDTGIIAARGTFTLKWDNWPDCGYFDIPLRPVQSVTSITYVDGNSVTQTWASTEYTLDANRVRPVILLGYDKTFPTARGFTNDITVTLIAGYNGAAAVPSMFKQAVLLNIARCMADREGLERGEQDLSAYVRAYEMLIRRMARTSYP